MITTMGSPSHAPQKQDLLADDISIGDLMELSVKSGAFDWLAIDELCGKLYRLADIPREERNGLGFLMAVFRKRLASSFVAFQMNHERRRDLIEALERDISEFDMQIRSQSSLYREEEEDDDEIDVGQAMDEERRRLLRITHDPQRRDGLQAERLYLQDYIIALRQIPLDSNVQWRTG